jgi:hypothetical protein
MDTLTFVVDCVNLILMSISIACAVITVTSFFILSRWDK